MRHPAIAALILCTYSATAQPDSLLQTVPLKDGLVHYEAVITVDSTAAVQLYRNARKFFVDNYRSGKDVLQIDDKESFELVGRGHFAATWMVTFYAPTELKVWHTIAFTAKDGRFRYEVKDFRIEYWASGYGSIPGRNVEMSLEEWNVSRPDNKKKVLAQVDASVKDLLDRLIKTAATPAKDDW